MALKKMWDHKLQEPNHTHPIVGHKANSIRRTEAAVMKTVSMLKSCRKLHKFAMKKQKRSVDLCVEEEEEGRGRRRRRRRITTTTDITTTKP